MAKNLLTHLAAFATFSYFTYKALNASEDPGVYYQEVC